MNIIDILLILAIVKSAFSGFKRGFFREILDIIAIIFSIIIAWKYMDIIANFFYQTLPFFNIKILGISIVSLNIFLYQIIAFVIMAVLLYAAANIIISITGLIKKAVQTDLSPKLDLIHSLLGGIVGLINGYIIVFILLFVFSPFLNNFAYYKKAPIKNMILYKTPVLTNQIDKYTSALKDVTKLSNKISKDKHKKKNSNKYNLEAIDIMLKYKVVSPETISKLNDQNKLSSIKNVETILEKYRKDKEND